MACVPGCPLIPWTWEKNPDWGLSRSNSLGFSLTPRAAKTVEAGPRGQPSCCHTLREWQTAAAGWAAAGPGEAGKAQPGRGRSQRPRHQRQHCGNGAAARGPREEGRKGGAAPPDPCLPAPPPFAPPARSGSPKPAAGLTCVADDDVLEEIGVRHGRGRSVPGSRLLLPLCASSAPSPAPLGREPGPRPPSVAVRASSKGRGAAGRTDSAERGSQRPSPSEQ